MTQGSFEIFKTPLKVEEDEKKEVKHITESTDVSSKQNFPQRKTNQLPSPALQVKML